MSFLSDNSELLSNIKSDYQTRKIMYDKMYDYCITGRSDAYTDYKNKHFKKHIRPLADSELPKIICKPDGTLMIDIDDEIEKMETTIIERLKHRDKNNVKCDYGIDWLHQCDDFINEIKVKRNLLNDKDYLAWLKEITNLTS